LVPKIALSMALLTFECCISLSSLLRIPTLSDFIRDCWFTGIPKTGIRKIFRNIAIGLSKKYLSPFVFRGVLLIFSGFHVIFIQ